MQFHPSIFYNILVLGIKLQQEALLSVHMLVREKVRHSQTFEPAATEEGAPASEK